MNKNAMMLAGGLLLPLLGFAAEMPSVSPVKVIFDSDMICDFDDVGALACLHALADAGECEILATLSCTRGNASVAAIEVINAYYGRGDLPVGAPIRRGQAHTDAWNLWGRTLASAWTLQFCKVVVRYL